MGLDGSALKGGTCVVYKVWIVKECGSQVATDWGCERDMPPGLQSFSSIPENFISTKEDLLV